MRISSAFPSKYLKAADLNGNQVSVVMSHVTMEDVGDDIKPVLYVDGSEKGIVLNKTNGSAIADAYGDDTDSWHGRTIILFEAQVTFNNKTAGAIRVKTPRVQHQAPLAQPAFGTVVATDPVMSGLNTSSMAAQRNQVNQGMLGTRIHSAVPVGTVVNDEIPF